MALTLADLPRLQEAVARVRPLDPTWITQAETRLGLLTKPQGSLGRLEHLAARVSAIQETLAPRSTPRRAVVFAASHGVAEEGVSAYPADVTAQMVANFLHGGAAINAFARVVEADLCVVDVGVQGRIDAAPLQARFVARRVRDGTRNMGGGPAMTPSELEAAINVGLDLAHLAAAEGIVMLVCGEMGIANTTAASAITAAVTGASPAEVTGYGTGIDDERYRHKIDVIDRALRINVLDTPLDVLAAVGGLEIAAIVGAYVGAAGHRLTLVGDGFTATAATVIASAICPAVVDYWIAGHRSPEPGHAVQLAWLRQQPLLDLAMRLGEGTGGVLALPLIDAAVAAMNEMATFEAANVSGRSREASDTRARQ